MRVAILCLLIALAFGCAQKQILVQPTPSDPPILSIDSQIAGRGCLYARYERDEAGVESLEVIEIQDGSSDWSVSRVVDRIVGVAGAVFGGGEPGKMMGPDPVHACADLWESSDPKRSTPDGVIYRLVPEPAR